MATEATIKTAIPTMSGFHNFAFFLLTFPFCEAGIFTLVESALQISSFMQNEPNFQKSQMNVSIFSQKDYENKWQRRVRKNEPKTNPNEPNQSQLKPIKCQYEPNTNPIRTQSQMQKNMFRCPKKVDNC